MPGENLLKQRVTRLPVGIAELLAQRSQSARALEALDVFRIEMRFRQRQTQKLESFVPLGSVSVLTLATQRIAPGARN